MTQSERAAVLALQGKCSAREASRRLGVGRTTVNKVWNASRKCEPSTQTAPFVPTTSARLSVKDVVGQYDVVGKAVEVLSGTPAGEVWRDESLRQELSLGGDRWRKVSGSMRLSGYFAILPDKTRVWGTKATISRLQTQIKEL
jgi:hypothetical protein